MAKQPTLVQLNDACNLCGKSFAAHGSDVNAPCPSAKPGLSIELWQTIAVILLCGVIIAELVWLVR